MKVDKRRIGAKAQIRRDHNVNKAGHSGDVCEVRHFRSSRRRSGVGDCGLNGMSYCDSLVDTLG